MKTLWCCFLWKWVQGRSEGSSPALLNAREVWTPPVFPGHGVCGQTTLLDCSFAWPWRKLTLGQGAQGRPRLGLGAETASAHLLISRLPLRTRCLCSLVCKAQPVRACLQHSWCFGFLLLFFGVVNGVWSCHLGRYSSLQTDHWKAVCFLCCGLSRAGRAALLDLVSWWCLLSPCFKPWRADPSDARCWQGRGAMVTLSVPSWHGRRLDAAIPLTFGRQCRSEGIPRSPASF